MFEKIKQDAVVSCKKVVYLSDNPDCEADCISSEYESYCEKFGLSSHHVQYDYIENYLYDNTLFDIGVVTVTNLLDELVTALKTFEFSIENRRENWITLRRLVGHLVIEDVKRTIEADGKKVSFSSFMGSDADSSDNYRECRSNAIECGLNPDKNVRIIDYENFNYSIDNHEFCFDLHFIVISNKLHQLIESAMNDQLNELEKTVTSNLVDSKYNSDSWEYFCKTNGLGGVKSGQGDGIVYFLLFPMSNLLKIGFTTNLQKRLSAYGSHCAEEFRVIKTIPGTKSKEKFIHKALKHYRSKKEFFKWNETVQSFVQSCG